MTDKVQLIKQEVEKLKSEYNKESHFRTVRGDTAREVLDKLLSFIDSIPEKLGCKKKDYRERYKRITQTEQFKKSYCDKSLGKEEFGCEVNFTTKNKDLEEEIERFLDEDENIPSYSKTARHFAEWQKQKMNDTLQTEYEKGRFDMREEMMKDSLDGWVSMIVESDPSSRNLFISTPQLYKELQKYENGDKLKIIIVKEEEL